jgi:hypothetical protein
MRWDITGGCGPRQHRERRHWACCDAGASSWHTATVLIGLIFPSGIGAQLTSVNSRRRRRNPLVWSPAECSAWGTATERWGRSSRISERECTDFGGGEAHGFWKRCAGAVCCGLVEGIGRWTH